ncbi:MAG: aminopeptidase P family N-terminal domain-containing protein, partial [Chloroflexota bacterium]
MNFQRRIDAARASMAEQGIDVLLVSQPANREYLSGFANADESASAAAAWVVLTPTAGYFVTSFLFFEGVSGTLRHLEAVKSESRPLPGTIELLMKLPGATIGFESAWVSHAVVEKLSEGIGVGRALKPIDGLIEGLRALKDTDELAILRRAIALTDRVY